jgi:predicted nucleic acid-binding protein
MTKIDDALVGVSRIYLDTSPVIYFVEKNPAYLDRVNAVFGKIDRLEIEAVASVVTLAECLVGAFVVNSISLADKFVKCLVGARGTSFHTLTPSTAEFAARLRAQHQLSLMDAFQVAAAGESGCQAILTNDPDLNRIPGLRVLVLDNLSV